MGHAGPGLSQQGQLPVVEPDPVGIPHVLADPAQPRHVFKGADAHLFQHGALLVPGLGEVGVKAHAEPSGEQGAL